MNERIKALMGQTLDEKFSGTWSTMDMQDLQKFAERFAELIVKECADACYKHKDVESFGIYPVRVAMVTKACSDNIKQHFGVEE